MPQVLAAGILTKDGRVLLRRAFSRSEQSIEGLISYISKVISQRSSSENTLFHTEYGPVMYQPVDSVIVFLASSRSGNVVEDFESLSLLGRIVSGLVSGQVGEKEVTDKMFDIIFAWDEAITNGFNNNLTVDEIQTYLEMKSHEEEIQLRARKLKEKAAIEANAEKLRELEEIRTGYRQPTNPILRGLSNLLSQIAGEENANAIRGHLGEYTGAKRIAATGVDKEYEEERIRTQGISYNTYQRDFQITPEPKKPAVTTFVTPSTSPSSPSTSNSSSSSTTTSKPKQSSLTGSPSSSSIGEATITPYSTTALTTSSADVLIRVPQKVMRLGGGKKAGTGRKKKIQLTDSGDDGGGGEGGDSA